MKKPIKSVSGIFLDQCNHVPLVVLMRMRLKITKKQSGTYTRESLSIKQLRELNKLKKKRRWEISKNGMNIYLEAE